MVRKTYNIYYNKLKRFYALDKKHHKYAMSILWKRLSNPIMLIANLPLLPFYLIIIVIIRLIRGTYVIRFGQLESEGIGHFSLPIEIYLLEVKSGVHSTYRHIDLWYTHKIVCNEALKKKWTQNLIIVPRLVKPLHLINRMIPGGELHEIPYRRITDDNVPWQIIDIHDVLPNNKPIIKFSETDIIDCIKLLKEYGFDITRKYVCFSVRDGTFHNDSDLSSHRNSSINEYSEAMIYLVKLGYQVLRIGSKTAETLSLNNPSIYDYATNGMRTELLDLFIISKCEFLIGTGSGIDSVASIFRRPQVFINIAEIGPLYWHTSDAIIIFKKLQAKDEGIIPLSKIYSNGYHEFTLGYQFEEANLKLIQNTNEEINAIIWEMHSRLNGIWKASKDEKELQTLFRSFWPIDPHIGKLRARIGVDFLRCNYSLLQ
jgi:putative glycosyltransferase (TIGR04372 family)